MMRPEWNFVLCFLFPAHSRVMPAAWFGLMGKSEAIPIADVRRTQEKKPRFCFVGADPCQFPPLDQFRAFFCRGGPTCPPPKSHRPSLDTGRRHRLAPETPPVQCRYGAHTWVRPYRGIGLTKKARRPRRTDLSSLNGTGIPATLCRGGPTCPPPKSQRSRAAMGRTHRCAPTECVRTSRGLPKGSWTEPKRHPALQVKDQRGKKGAARPPKHVVFGKPSRHP